VAKDGTAKNGKADLNDPVKSLTPGLKTVSAKKLAPLDTNFRFRSHPYTPPGPNPVSFVPADELGLGYEEYRVPVTISRLNVFCWRISSGINLG
jgi:hypothetical protein